MEHFGITLKNTKNGLELNKKNYVVVSDRCTLPYFSDIFVQNEKYLDYPKSFSVDYLTRLIDFYEKEPNSELTSHQIKNFLAAKQALKAVLKTEEDSCLKHIERLWSEGTKLQKEEFANAVLKHNLKKVLNYDLKRCIQGRFYSKEWCERQAKEVEENFDLNMSYFDKLDEKSFNYELNLFLERHKEFVEVDDLQPFYFKSGYYIMVLDKYKQVYIGTTNNITNRIVTHWTKRKGFDRLVFPWHAVETSVLSIDSFRALDTTRIFVYVAKNIYDRENEFIQDFPRRFLLNRVTGGNLLVLPLEKKDLKNGG